jgi:uncharacterized repeat protein (TIGR03803 family)
MGRLSGWKTACFIFTLWAGIASQAQTFTNLVTFDITNGAYPVAALVQGLDGNFYGTTAGGNGRNQCTGGCGEVFKVTPAGALTIIHSFSKSDGAFPAAGLVLATSGNFYGSTNGCSPIVGAACVPFFFFEITPEGALTNFLTPYPTSTAMIQYNVNGNLYGTTVNGSVGDIFAMTPSGTISTVYNFDNGNPGGEGSPLAPLVEGKDGFFYGTTENGGDNATLGCQENSGCGMVFKAGTGGHIDLLHKFDDTDDGYKPLGGLIQGSDGNFYGTTLHKGTNIGGTVFKITPAGVLTTLYVFGCSIPSCPNGTSPLSGVVQATDGNFYGTTYLGGDGAPHGCPNGCGTIFQLTPAGTLTTLHSFDQTDGGYPQGGLVQGTDGDLYGITTGTPGSHIYGTVFKLSLGLAPFVRTVPTAAYPGKTIFILGTNLTGATSVTFNGSTAAFAVVSATEITATVPKGSTTGDVQVTTPSGTLSSNVAFKVF